MAVQEETHQEEPVYEIGEILAQPARVAQYSARRIDLRLVKHPVYPIYGGGGNKVGEAPGQAVQFRNGLLTIDLTQEKTQIDAGREIDTQELVAWLENHRLLGDSEEGFFKVETAAPEVSQAEMDAIAEAAMLLDVDKLQELIDAETAGWGREKILGTARKTIESIEKLKEEAAKRADAEAAKQVDAAKVKPKAQ